MLQIQRRVIRTLERMRANNSMGCSKEKVSNSIKTVWCRKVHTVA